MQQEKGYGKLASAPKHHIVGRFV